MEDPWSPGSPKARDPHPTDEDLSVGTPDPGHPELVVELRSQEDRGRPPRRHELWFVRGRFGCDLPTPASERT
jgi:hypothetical protein